MARRVLSVTVTARKNTTDLLTGRPHAGGRWGAGRGLPVARIQAPTAKPVQQACAGQLQDQIAALVPQTVWEWPRVGQGSPCHGIL